MIRNFDGGAFISYAVRHKISPLYVEKRMLINKSSKLETFFYQKTGGKLSMISRYY